MEILVKRFLKLHAVLLTAMAGLLVAGCVDTKRIAAQAHYRQGVAHFEQGKYQLSIQEYNKAAALAPAETAPLTGRGNTYLAMGKTDMAFRDFNRAVMLNPLLTFQFRGNAYFLMGKFVEAAEDYRSRLTLAPKDTFAALFLYIAEVRSHKKRRDSLKRNAAKLDMSAWDAPIVRLFLQEVSPDQALKGVRSKGDQLDRLCDAYFFIGQWHLIRGENAKARRFFEKAVATKAVPRITWSFSKAELKRGIR